MDESERNRSNPPFKDDCILRKSSDLDAEMLRRICPDDQADAGDFNSDHKKAMDSDRTTSDGRGKNAGTSRCGCCGRSDFCLRLRDAARSPLTMPMLGAFIVFWLCTVSNSSFIVGAASTMFPNRADYEAWREFAYQVLQSYLTVHMLIALPHRLLYAFRLYRWTPADVASLRRNLTAGAKRMQLLKEGLAKTRRRKTRRVNSRGASLKGEEKDGKGAAHAVPVSRSASVSLLSPTALPLLVLRPHERVHMSVVVTLLLVNAAAQLPLFLYMVLQAPAHRSWAVIGALLSIAVAALVLASAYATFSPLGRRLQAIPRRRSVEARAEGEGDEGEWRVAAMATEEDAGEEVDGRPELEGKHSSNDEEDPAAAAARSVHAHIPILTSGLDMEDALSGSLGVSSAVSTVESGRLASVSAPLPRKEPRDRASHLPTLAHAHADALAHANKHSNSGSSSSISSRIPIVSTGGAVAWRSGELIPQRACLLPVHANPALSSFSSSSDLPLSLSLTLTPATASETTAAVIAAVSPYQPRYAHTHSHSRSHTQAGHSQQQQGAVLPVVRYGSERYEQEMERKRKEEEKERKEAEEEEHSRVLSLATAEEEEEEEDDDELPVSQHISTLPPKLAMWQPPMPMQMPMRQSSLSEGAVKACTGTTAKAGEGEGEGERAVRTGEGVRSEAVDGPQWVGSLWDCCSDPSFALQALACFFCTHGRHISGIGFGNAAAHTAQFALFLLAPIAVCVPSARFIPVPAPYFLLIGLGIAASVVGFVAYGGYFRWRMRRTFNLPPSPFLCIQHKALADVLSWLLCPCASLCQEVRTAQEHHLHVITVVPSSWDVPAGTAAAAAGANSSGDASDGVAASPAGGGAGEKRELGLKGTAVLCAPRVEEMSNDKENISIESRQK